MAFIQNPITPYTEAQMLAQLPSAGNYYWFYNLDKGSDLYMVDSSGNFTFVASAASQCCTCELSSSWLCAINESLTTGLITASQYLQMLSAGFMAVQTMTSPGNCSIAIGLRRSAPTSVVITTSSTSVAVGATLQLGISASPAGSDPSVVWVSSNVARATVDQTGLVTGVGAGAVTITAYSSINSAVYDGQDLTVT